MSSPAQITASGTNPTSPPTETPAISSIPGYRFDLTRPEGSRNVRTESDFDSLHGAQGKLQVISYFPLGYRGEPSTHFEKSWEAAVPVVKSWLEHLSTSSIGAEDHNAGLNKAADTLTADGLSALTPFLEAQAPAGDLEGGARAPGGVIVITMGDESRRFDLKMHHTDTATGLASYSYRYTGDTAAETQTSKADILMVARTHDGESEGAAGALATGSVSVQVRPISVDSSSGLRTRRPITFTLKPSDRPVFKPYTNNQFSGGGSMCEVTLATVPDVKLYVEGDCKTVQEALDRGEEATVSATKVGFYPALTAESMTKFFTNLHSKHTVPISKKTLRWVKESGLAERAGLSDGLPELTVFTGKPRNFVDPHNPKQWANM